MVLATNDQQLLVAATVSGIAIAAASAYFLSSKRNAKSAAKNDLSYITRTYKGYKDVPATWTVVGGAGARRRSSMHDDQRAFTMPFVDAGALGNVLVDYLLTVPGVKSVRCLDLYASRSKVTVRPPPQPASPPGR